MAKKFTLPVEPELLKLYGFDQTLSNSPVRLPFPGAMGVETPTGTVPNPVSQMYNQLLQFEEERGLLYALYDEMELDPTIYAYLQQLSEDATQRDPRKGTVCWCSSRNKDIEYLINGMLAVTGAADWLAQPIIWQFSKYGDEFEFIMGEPQKGVTRLINYHPATVTRVHDEYGRLKGFTPYQYEDTATYGIQAGRPKNQQLISAPYDFLHFRKLGRSPNRIYGTSVLFGARRIWRQVQMMEDKVALSRLIRNVDRYKHTVDVTGLSPIEAEIKINKYRQGIKRDMNFNQGEMTFASVYNILAENEDLFIGKRKDDETDIQVLAGTKGIDDLRDLEMFMDRLFGALRAPKGYFGFEGNANFERSPSQQDMRFAKQASALQRVYLSEITRLGMMHLMFLGINPFDEDNAFTLYMVPPSSLEELYRLETVESRVRTLEALARVGNTLGFDAATWLELVITEFPVFSEQFSEVFLDNIDRLQAQGPSNPEETESETNAESVMSKIVKSKEVQEIIEKEIKEEKPDWEMCSLDTAELNISPDIYEMIKEERTNKRDRAGFNEKFRNAIEIKETVKEDKIDDNSETE